MIKERTERIAHLTHKIFLGTEDGKELIQLWKDALNSQPLFPNNNGSDEFDKFGGPIGYANYYQGRRSWIDVIELMSLEYANKISAENSQKR